MAAKPVEKAVNPVVAENKTPTKKREMKAEMKTEEKEESAKRVSDKTFKQMMAELQAEAQGEKADQPKKNLFAGNKRPSTAAQPSSAASKKLKK